jgi:ABC-type Fe3+/spermidine/putrescine transport system ATPase subunit
MTEVKLDSVTKRYTKETALAVDSLSMTAESGKLTTILGPSGCGKSTVLKAIAGLIGITSGDILFDRKSVLSLRAENRNAVMMFQNHLLFPYMNVGDNISFGLRMQKQPKPEIQRLVAKMLNRIQLSGLEHRKPSELSGGQQQRVALARALITKPKVLLLDEPLSNLDAHLRVEMRELIKSLQQETRITTLLVTHDQEEAVILGDKLALMLNGKLRQFGPAKSFYNFPKDEEVARFFGGKNFIRGYSSGGKFTCTLQTLNLPPDCEIGEGILTFRPESVKINARLESENSFAINLLKKTYLGTHTRLYFGNGSEEIEALVHPEIATTLQENQLVTICLPRNSLWVLT